MENVVQLNPYVNMTFDQLMEASNAAMKNPNEAIMSALMKEFNRRLQIEIGILSNGVNEVRGKL
jgi:hypothetical protein